MYRVRASHTDRPLTIQFTAKHALPITSAFSMDTLWCSAYMSFTLKSECLSVVTYWFPRCPSWLNMGERCYDHWIWTSTKRTITVLISTFRVRNFWTTAKLNQDVNIHKGLHAAENWSCDLGFKRINPKAKLWECCWDVVQNPVNRWVVCHIYVFRRRVWGQSSSTSE
jgi:hypothetical protein